MSPNEFNWMNSWVTPPTSEWYRQVVKIVVPNALDIRYTISQSTAYFIWGYIKLAFITQRRVCKSVSRKVIMQWLRTAVHTFLCCSWKMNLFSIPSWSLWAGWSCLLHDKSLLKRFPAMLIDGWLSQPISTIFLNRVCGYTYCVYCLLAATPLHGWSSYSLSSPWWESPTTVLFP